MNTLLDTHTFLWWANEPERLSARVRALLENPKMTLLLSVVSLWEIQIKAQSGKLTLTIPLKTLVETQQRTNQIQVLPVTLAHILALDDLPLHHKDPFDRLLIAQANVENAVLASVDAVFGQYPVNVIW
jgi:PIN domain nuclease of toxin-antitoxin system